MRRRRRAALKLAESQPRRRRTGQCCTEVQHESEQKVESFMSSLGPQAMERESCQIRRAQSTRRTSWANVGGSQLSRINGAVGGRQYRLWPLPIFLWTKFSSSSRSGYVGTGGLPTSRRQLSRVGKVVGMKRWATGRRHRDAATRRSRAKGHAGWREGNEASKKDTLWQRRLLRTLQ